MSAVIETGERRLQVFCPAHRVSFECLGAGRVVCDLGPHLLAERFPHTEVWEYCCDCRSCWPSPLGQGSAAAEQCPVCARPTARRFICAACKLVSLDSDEARRKPYAIGRGGAVRPACPGCGTMPAASPVEHYCEAAKAAFVTSRPECLLCREPVVELPAFPAALDGYLRRVEAAQIATVPVRYDAGKKALVPSPRGDFLMLKTSSSKLSIALPRASRIDSTQDFQKRYGKCYACDGPAAGEVVVTYPATFSRVDGLWTLKEIGHLEVVADAPTPSRDGDGEVLTQEAPACVECGLATRPGESLCESCVEPPARPEEAGGVDGPPGDAFDETRRPSEPEARPDAVENPRPVPPQSRGGKFIALAVVAVALLGGSAFLLMRLAAALSTESRLRVAVERGELIRPQGRSARDLYRQLQQSAPGGGSALADVERQLLPKLKGTGQQVIDAFATPGTPDPGIAQWEAAQELFEWAAELAPSDARVRARATYCRGRVSYLSGDKRGALDIWKAAADQDASWALPSNGVGLIHNELSEHVAARPHLQEAIRRDPSWAVPYNNLGTSFYYTKDYVRAAAYYRMAAERAPNWARPHAWLGDIAMRQKDYDTAAREFEQVLSPAATGTSEMNLDKIKQELARARRSQTS